MDKEREDTVQFLIALQNYMVKKDHGRLAMESNYLKSLIEKHSF